MKQLQLVLLTLLGFSLQAQQLSPKELEKIVDATSSEAIRNILVPIGYQPKIEDGTLYWNYQNGASDILVVASVRKRYTPNGNTTFNLYDPFHYKKLIEDQLNRHYVLKGVEVRSKRTWLVFRNENYTFRLAEISQEGNPGTYEINMSRE